MAIRTVGLKSLPFLMTALQTNAGPNKPGSLRAAFWGLKATECWQPDEAATVFRILGPAAAPAAPILRKAMNVQNTELILDCLAPTQTNASALYRELLSRTNDPCRRAIANHACRSFWGGDRALLNELTRDSDSAIRLCAFRTLLRHELPVEELQQTLASALTDSDSTVSNVVLQDLACVRKWLWLVLPELRGLTNNIVCKGNALFILRTEGLAPPEPPKNSEKEPENRFRPFVSSDLDE